MKIFPKYALANIHLFRDYYHRPTYKNIGKKGYVQADTLRARYCSLESFIEFLRKNQIYAGMIRAELQILQQTINDFNKEYNPLIR